MTEPADKFRKAAPLIDLTPEVIGNLRTLLDTAQKHASVTGLPWRSVPSGGKPILCANEATKGCTIAYGTIGSWNEIDLAVAAVNALPALLATLQGSAALPSEAMVEAAFREGYDDGWCTGTAAMEEDRAWSVDADWERSNVRAAMRATTPTAPENME